MKILFDNQKFSTDKHGGIVRYFAELMRHYDAMPDVQYDLPIAFSNNEYLAALPRFAGKLQPLRGPQDFLPRLAFRGKGRLYRLWCKFFAGRDNTALLRDALQRQDFDLLHPTYYDPSLLKYAGDKPIVLTVYDMIHELYLAKFAAIDPTIASKKKMMQHAARIIAISASTKRDIVTIAGIDPDKIDVVYLGNSLVPDQQSLQTRPDGAPARYLLFVGTRIEYKNFLPFARAMLPLLREQNDLHVVCVGWSDFDAAEQDLFAKARVADRFHRVGADDQLLARYYAHAEAFVFPSLYEGFGIPVLEAFACDCPAIISNTSSLPEVGGEAAAYFNPHSEADMHRAVREVLTSPDKRQAMITAGRAQLQNFSWGQCAQETVDVYRRVLRQRAA